jgi:hypothetical protein
MEPRCGSCGGGGWVFCGWCTAVLISQGIEHTLMELLAEDKAKRKRADLRGHAADSSTDCANRRGGGALNPLALERVCRRQARKVDTDP